MSPPASESVLQPATAKNPQQALSINTNTQSLDRKNESGTEATPPSCEDGNPTQVPRESAQRTFSDPLPSASPNPLTHSISTPVSAHPSSDRHSSLPQQPKSTGRPPFRTLRFALKGKDEENDRDSAVSPTMRSPTSRAEMGKPKRRHSHEPRVNVHTECGRHSDDWLFGGFSVSGTMKRIWEKKE